MEDRASTRFSHTPVHITTTRQSDAWFPSGVELAEGFYSPDVASFSC